jgi:plastocyanin
MPKQTLGRTFRRIRGMYFPPWVPVAFIMVVVIGILGALFIVRGATGAPRIAEHHWHAPYSIFICGQRQPNFPSWPGGVHTHADGVIHIHPNLPQEEGAGARLVKWFEYGGGRLTQTEMQLVGKPRDEVYKNDDTCPDGSEAVLQVFVNGVKMDNWSRYIPQDGDTVRIIFGPEQETEDVDVSTPIPESEAVREVELEISDIDGDERTTTLNPDSIELRPGETVKLALKNTGGISHFLQVSGPDGEYETGDDFYSGAILPGKEGAVVVRFDEEGEFEFRDRTVTPETSGVLVVAGEPVDEVPADATPGADPSEPVDVTLTVKMGDSFFEPAELEVEAGQKFRIELTNEGEFVHNLRIAGPDDTFDTKDDLVSSPDPPRAGENGAVVGQIDEPGTYRIRSDFQPSEMVGTITVK